MIVEVYGLAAIPTLDTDVAAPPLDSATPILSWVSRASCNDYSHTVFSREQYDPGISMFEETSRELSFRAQINSSFEEVDSPHYL